MQFVINHKKTQVKQHLATFLKISIAILAISYLFRSDWLTKESFIKLFRTDNIPFIIFSCLFFISAQILCASRLVLLLKTIDFNLPFLKGFKLIMIGNFFNTIIPGMVGGDFVKGFFLIKSEESKRGKSSGIIIMDRALGLIALTFIGSVSLIYLLQQNNASLSSYRHELYIVLGVIGFLSALSGAFFVFGRNNRVRKKMREIITAIFRKSFFYYLTEGLGALARNHRILICSLAISILIQLLSLAGLLILSNILHETLPDVTTLTAVSSLIILLNVIPVTPGNIGWTELIAAFGWSAVGSNAGAEIFFYWRIVTVLCSLPGSLLYLTYGEKPKVND